MIRGIETEKCLRAGRKNSARGFSLIEILVVLVVLLIGILAIVRLFPPGFLIIGRTYDLTVAGSLAQQQLDAERNMLAPMEAIVSLSPDHAYIGSSSQPVIVSDTRPDDLSDYSTGDVALNGLDPYYSSNVNRFTRVLGEIFRIPLAASNSGGGKGAVYTLQFGPVSNVFTTTGGTPQDSLLVRGTPLERTEQNSVGSNNFQNGDPVLRSDAEYAIDYKNGKIAFSPRVYVNPAPAGTRKYVFEYDYYTNTTPVTIKHTAGSIAVPDVTNGQRAVWQPIFDGVNNIMPADMAQMKYNSDDVSRQFVLMSVTPIENGGATNFDGDPYEYVWYSKQQSTNANIGVLLFNPTGYDQVALNARGNKPLTARVDYTIFDNHIIRDDRVVPTSVPYTFRLTLNHLTINGDVLDNQATYNNFVTQLNPYNGLFRDPMALTPDLIVLNTTTGDVVGTWQNNNGSGVLSVGPQNPTPFEPGSGTVTLNKANVEADRLEGTNLRYLYRASKDWGMQLQKAAAHYLPGTQVADIDFRHYLVAPSGSAFPTRIYFAPCDGGKSVVLGQYYDLSLTGSSSANNPISNEVYQIVNDPGLLDSYNLPYVDTRSKHPSFTGFSATQTGLPVLNVQGVSLKSRVVWRAGSRWRKLDTDTILAATPLK